jgi:hypothetical protein
LGPNNRPWYREPETYIALAALIVSLSAVVVGIYEAALQRAHDRAEVWPHLEVLTFTTPQGASVYLENTGLGPAIVNSAVVTVDGKPQRNWPEAMAGLFRGNGPQRARTLSVRTVDDHALRAGDKVQMIGLAPEDLPPNFWDWIGRVRISVCYESAFHDHWRVSARLGVTSSWESVRDCPIPVHDVQF